MPDLGDLEKYAGIIGMACFAGVFLGGMLLSYYWKTFGPWKQLEELKKELTACEEHREESSKLVARAMAEVAELKARYEIFREALGAGGFQLIFDKVEEERVAQRVAQIKKGS